jgi:hypothetical protein
MKCAALSFVPKNWKKCESFAISNPENEPPTEKIMLQITIGEAPYRKTITHA